MVDIYIYTARYSHSAVHSSPNSYLIRFYTTRPLYGYALFLARSSKASYILEDMGGLGSSNAWNQPYAGSLGCENSASGS